AVSILYSVEVIFIKKDKSGEITADIVEEVNAEHGLTERVIYYHVARTGIGFIDRFFSHRKYKSIYKRALKKYLELNGKPAFVHNYIAMKAGLMALWLKRKYNIPYIVSEQWTGYLDEAKPNINSYNFIQKRWCQKIFSGAIEVMTVSKVLGEAVSKRFDIKKYTVIPNVVNTNIFFPKEKTPSQATRLVHVSLLNYQKNFTAMTEALQKVKEKGYQFNLTVYGNSRDEALRSVKETNLEKEIIFKREVPQEILVHDIQDADAMLFYSRYETFGCVVIEANACGIPVILSDLPVFREYVIENKTGIFVKPGNPDALAEKIIYFIENKERFPAEEIASHTKEHFSYSAVAEQFDTLYKRTISNSDHTLAKRGNLLPMRLI
ncbi:MAG: glycosyltransferase, partial [Parafilimonas sp.]